MSIATSVIYAMIAHLLLRYTYDVVGMWSATSAVSLLVGFFFCFLFLFFLCILLEKVCRSGKTTRLRYLQG